MFPIKNRLILDNLTGDIVCVYLDNVLIPDEQYRFRTQTPFDSYFIRIVEIELEIDNKNYFMYYSIDLTYMAEDVNNCILPLRFQYAQEV